MRQWGWTGKAKALAATTVLACAAMFASTSAQADYSYTFSIMPLNGNIGPAYGSFTTDNMLSSSVKSYITSSSYNYTINGNLYQGNSTGINQILPNFYPTTFVFQFSDPNATLSVSSGFAAGNVTYSSTGVSATTSVTEFVGTGTNAARYSGSGLFSALLTSAPSGGGGGSGGVPTPEVNAGLGLLLAGATFAFLRRKHGTRLEAAAA